MNLNAPIFWLDPTAMTDADRLLAARGQLLQAGLTVAARNGQFIVTRRLASRTDKLERTFDSLAALESFARA